MRKQIYKEIAEQTGVTAEAVKLVESQMFAYIRSVLARPEFRTPISEEEFLSMRTSVKVPFLGDFYIYIRHWRRVQKLIRNKFDYDKYKKSNPEIYQSADNSEDGQGNSDLSRD